jgi:hypothetical protein
VKIHVGTVLVIAKYVLGVIPEQIALGTGRGAASSLNCCAGLQVCHRASGILACEVCSKNLQDVTRRRHISITLADWVAARVSVLVVTCELLTIKFMVVWLRNEATGAMKSVTFAFFATTLVIVGNSRTIHVVAKDVGSVVSQHEARWARKHRAGSFLDRTCIQVVDGTRFVFARQVWRI